MVAVTLGEDGPRAAVVTVVTGSTTVHMRVETQQAVLEWALVIIAAAAARELEPARSNAKKRQSLQMVRGETSPGDVRDSRNISRECVCGVRHNDNANRARRDPAARRHIHTEQGVIKKGNACGPGWI